MENISLQANPGLARILISVLYPLGAVFCLYCLSFMSEFEKSQTTQNISNGKHFFTKKMDTPLTFNPWLALTGFQTTRPRVFSP